MPRRKERIKFAGAVFRVGVGERKRHGVPSQSQSGGIGKSDTSRLIFFFFFYMIVDTSVRHLGALAGFDV